MFFYKTLNILTDFADRDTTARLNHSLRVWCGYDDSGFYPYETLLGKTMNIMAGVSSSLSYMRLSIHQIKREDLSEDIEKEGFRDYDLYRYHYIVFSHSIALLQTRVQDNILKSKEQKNIQPTKGGHKMVTWQNYVSLFYCKHPVQAVLYKTNKPKS